MNPYIELVGGPGLMRRYGLTSSDLLEIGKFTRGNVLMWMESHRGVDWVDVLPIEDFHAVHSDIDIPWATEEAKGTWRKWYPNHSDSSSNGMSSG